MKKRVLLFSVIILSLIIILPLVLAQNETDDEDEEDTLEIIETGFGEEIDAAYSCLKSQLGTDCADTPSTEQNVFSLLAMGYDSAVQSDCKEELQDKEDNDCWGKTGSDSCNLKSTAQSIIALDYIGGKVDDEVDRLLDKKELVEDLN